MALLLACGLPTWADRSVSATEVRVATVAACERCAKLADSVSTLDGTNALAAAVSPGDESPIFLLAASRIWREKKSRLATTNRERRPFKTSPAHPLSHFEMPSTECCASSHARPGESRWWRTRGSRSESECAGKMECVPERVTEQKRYKHSTLLQRVRRRCCTLRVARQRHREECRALQHMYRQPGSDKTSA